MNTISLTHDLLTVEPAGLDKLWSLRRRLQVPLAHVRGATFDPGANHEHKGFRGPGLHLPNKIAGTFRRDGESAFWNVSGRGRTIEVELADERLARLYLTVADPRGAVDQINTAVR
ncbi:MAG: hypothetical protein M3130_05790 [Actinomycetota bacterium]|nr:hypothetical protein [Actinomycetota bacterium]